MCSLIEDDDGEELWYTHDHQSWKCLKAIVDGVSINGQSESTLFLEKYLQVVSWAFDETGDVTRIFSRIQWEDQLALVSKFAPDLFLEQNETTGNTFLNHMLDATKMESD